MTGGGREKERRGGGSGGGGGDGGGVGVEGEEANTFRQLLKEVKKGTLAIG